MNEIEALLTEQIPRLRRYARALTTDRSSADDLVQDTLERAWGKLYMWRRGSDIRAWMFSIMHNTFINHIKVLYWHRNGFCLWQKRLEHEKFHWPKHGESTTQTVTLREFEWLLEGIDLWRNKPHKTLEFACVS